MVKEGRDLYNQFHELKNKIDKKRKEYLDLNSDIPVGILESKLHYDFEDDIQGLMLKYWTNYLFNRAER